MLYTEHILVRNNGKAFEYGGTSVGTDRIKKVLHGLGVLHMYGVGRILNTELSNMKRPSKEQAKRCVE